MNKDLNCSILSNYSFEKTIATLNSLQSNHALRKNMRPSSDHNFIKTKKLCCALGFTERLKTLSFIHVTGTKGKGSTSFYTDYVLRKSARLKTGCFASPHLVSVTERIRINGKPIDKTIFIMHFWRVFSAISALKLEKPGYFAMITLVSLSVFLEEKPDVVLFEVGIGGKYDSTNVIPSSDICVFTPIGLDHQEILGKNVTRIAEQKAGIIKNNSQVFTVANQHPDALQVSTVL